ncbi:MAG TPA: methyl-accepting chemotaxis protein [Geomobilimonas sp.]|nr:methyl-accepting chemotaxis protein [Geomobilimonas sp.]
MAKDLNRGSRLIRFLLITALVCTAIGIYAAFMMVATAGVRSYAYASGAAMTLNGVAVLGVMLMLARRKLVHKVKVLAAAMDRGSEGDLTAKVDATSDDEFGMLNANFNAMLDKLGGMTGRVNLTLAELRQIAADINEVAGRGVAAARVQSEAVAGTTGAVQEIDQSVHEVALSVESLAGSATENAASIQEMSASIDQVIQNVEALALAVTEVSSSIFEMAAAEKEIGSSVTSLLDESRTATALVTDLDLSIKQVEKHAVDTAAISETVRQDAESGRTSVEATISGIGEIRRASGTAFAAIEHLSARAVDIGKILSVIDEVAEQTKLLSLNASIIAAQAGEQGKGFAVVADEIKELARRTSDSTREIGEIVKGVQEETGHAVAAIKVVEQRVVEGGELSQRSGTALDKIVGGVQMATERVEVIARTTEEQSMASQEMSRVMERVAQMVSQIDKSTREQGHGNELIMAAAERMKALTGQVRTSTREQSSTGKHIVRATEEISSMIEQIRNATGVQTEGSQRIVGAMADVERATRTNVEASKVMDGAVARLTGQIELLKKEMGGFKVQGEK